MSAAEESEEAMTSAAAAIPLENDFMLTSSRDTTRSLDPPSVAARLRM
jgi:hypothetical protein